MNSNHCRMVGVVGMAAGALLAPPLIALLASPLASADPADILTIGPFTASGLTETLSINDVTFGLDNYLVSATPALDLDLWYGPGTDNFGLIVTDPGVFQLGYDDIGGTTSFIDAFIPADFINPDLGLSGL